MSAEACSLLGMAPFRESESQVCGSEDELRLRGASELWAGAVAGTHPDGASPPLCSAVVAGPMAFLCLKDLPAGPHSPLILQCCQRILGTCSREFPVGLAHACFHRTQPSERRPVFLSPSFTEDSSALAGSSGSPLRFFMMVARRGAALIAS